jgi:hypothetical protein
MLARFGFTITIAAKGHVRLQTDVVFRIKHVVPPTHSIKCEAKLGTCGVSIVTVDERISVWIVAVANYRSDFVQTFPNVSVT